MSSAPLLVGRYALHGALASGGMATVHVGRLLGSAGFARTVAIKRLHAQFARDPEFIAMFLDEARLAARIRHPNVVPTLDVVSEGDELFLVMEYVHGESLSRAWRATLAKGERIPPAIASAILVGAMHGLHAAHEARDEQGQPMQVVHRDVSPQNVIVGADGVSRVLDFGIAKALRRSHQTRDGQLKGKLAYMAPEQFRREPVTRAVDVYAASVVLWEALTGERLHAGDSEASVVERVLYGEYRPVRDVLPALPAEIDEILCRGLARRPDGRPATARELAVAVEECLGAASAIEVSSWLEGVAGPQLTERARLVEAVEVSVSVPQRPFESTRIDASPPALSVDDPLRPAQVTLTTTRTSQAAPPASGGEAPAPTAPGSRNMALGVLGAMLLVTGFAAFALRGSHAAAGPLPGSGPTVASTAPAPAAPDSAAPPVPLPPTEPVVASIGMASGVPETSSPTPRRSRPPARFPSPPNPSVLPRGLPASRD